jgi:hypothetical protein
LVVVHGEVLCPGRIEMAVHAPDNISHEPSVIKVTSLPV